MSNCSRGRQSRPQPENRGSQAQEVPVRRWPHPIPCAEEETAGTVLRAMRCELAAQTRLLCALCREMSEANAYLKLIAENTAAEQARE